jgi:hypothetical protein
MDELDLIERFRAEAPKDENARASARSRLMEAMEPRRSAYRTTRRRAPRLAWTFAAAAVVAALALVAPAIVPGGEEAPAAAATLRGAARVAAVQPWTPVGPGEYVYTKSRFEWQTTDQGRPVPIMPDLFGRNGALVELVELEDLQVGTNEGERELWIGPDGSGRLVQRINATEWDQTYEAGELFFLDLSAIPTDLDALRSYVDEHSGPATPAEAAPGEAPDDMQAFGLIALLLRETNASPELRAALFEVVATIPGVELVGEVVDGAGRSGVAVGYEYGSERHELIFDPDTSAILEERVVRLDGDGAGETVIGSTVYLRSAVVGSVDERP